MMNVLKTFVSFNRKICRKLDNLFPHIFKNKTDYNEDLLKEIYNYIYENKISSVLELGGWNQPLLEKSQNFKYYGLDIKNLSDHKNFYDDFYFQSTEDNFQKKFDLIISRHVLEHIKDNDKTFRNIYKSLNSDCYTINYFPSKNHFYSLFLRLVGPVLQKKLIKILRPGPVNQTGYQTYFSYCSITEIKNLLTSIGFKDIKIKNYYRATDYFAFFFPLYLIIGIFEFLFEKYSISYFASGIKISAKK